MSESGKKSESCVLCGNKAEEVIFTRKREAACTECYNLEKRYGTLLLKIGPEGYSKVHFSENFNFFESNTSAFPLPVIGVKTEVFEQLDTRKVIWEINDEYEILDSGVFGNPAKENPPYWDISKFEFAGKSHISSEIEVYLLISKPREVQFASCAIAARKEYKDEAFIWTLRFRKFIYFSTVGNLEGAQYKSV